MRHDIDSGITRSRFGRVGLSWSRSLPLGHIKVHRSVASGSDVLGRQRVCTALTAHRVSQWSTRDDRFVPVRQST